MLTDGLIDFSMLSELSELHPTTTKIHTSQSVDEQDLDSSPGAEELETSDNLIVGDESFQDISNMEDILSSAHDAVVAMEETVHEAEEGNLVDSENCESIDQTQVIEDSQVGRTKLKDFGAAVNSVQVELDSELAVSHKTPDTDKIGLNPSDVYTGFIQLEREIEIETCVEPGQDPAVPARLEMEAEQDLDDDVETEQVATAKTKEPFSVAGHEPKDPVAAVSSSIKHNFSPIGESSELSPSHRAPPPNNTSDTFGFDGSSDNTRQEQEYVESPSEQIFEHLVKGDIPQLPTPANTQAKEVQFSEADSQESQQALPDLEGEEVEEVSVVDTTKLISESENKTARVAINVLDPPRTPNQRDSVLVTTNPELKTRISPRRSQRIGKSNEPTTDPTAEPTTASTEDSSQIMLPGSLTSVEAEGGDDEETTALLLDDKTTPAGHDASIEMAMSALDSPSKQTYGLRPREPIVDLKLRLFRNLRTELVDYTALKLLRYHLNKKLDILAIATTSTPDKNHQSASGLGHWHTTFNITDASIAPSGVTEIQISRPYQEALPIVHAGDGILLRNFVVHASKDKGFILRSEKNEACSWAVFKDGQDKPEMRGPPVEYDNREENHIIAMKDWYRSLDSVATAKLGRANANKAGATSKGAGKAS